MATVGRSATLSEGERFKLIKWARKNGAQRISIDGVEITFTSQEPERPFFSEKPWKPLSEPSDSSVAEPLDAARRRGIGAMLGLKQDPAPQEPLASESTQKAPPALRSRLDDPDLFAQMTDEWANQTRLPRQ